MYSYSGDYSLADSPNGNYNSNVTSFARFNQNINLTEATNASVSFMARYNLEPGYDYCYFQVALAGSNYETVDTFNGITDWTLKEYPLNDYLGNEINIRFLFTSDQSIEEEGIYIDDFTLYITAPDVSVSEDILTTRRDQLYQNYPNPFNPETTISFAIVEEGEVIIDIYNIIGQRVKRLIQEELTPGFYNITWDGKNESSREVSSGIYFYRMQRKDYTAVKKMILLK